MNKQIIFKSVGGLKAQCQHFTILRECQSV